MVNKEINKEQLQAYLDLIDRHIAGLEEKSRALKENIGVMRAKGDYTQPQDKLLFSMLEVLKSMKASRLKVLESLGSDVDTLQSSKNKDRVEDRAQKQAYLEMMVTVPMPPS